jgi:hypothetical protein
MSDIPNKRRRKDTEQEEESEEAKALTDLQQLCTKGYVGFTSWNGGVATLRLDQLPILPASVARFEKLQEPGTGYILEYPIESASGDWETVSTLKCNTSMPEVDGSPSTHWGPTESKGAPTV